jgi:hypothetical protein
MIYNKIWQDDVLPEWGPFHLVSASTTKDCINFLSKSQLQTRYCPFCNTTHLDYFFTCLKVRLENPPTPEKEFWQSVCCNHCFLEAKKSLGQETIEINVKHLFERLQYAFNWDVYFHRSEMIHAEKVAVRQVLASQESKVPVVKQKDETNG